MTRDYPIDYPRVIQIMPCENIWLEYHQESSPKIFYSRAFCLCLMEEVSWDGKEEVRSTHLVYADQSDVESSLAIDFGGYKNIIYSLTQPEDRDD